MTKVKDARTIDARTTIETLKEQFLEYLLRRDVDGIAGMYTRAALLMRPDSDFLRGREAIRANWRNFLQAPVREARIEPLEVERLGEAISEIGRVFIRMDPPGPAGPVMFYARFLFIWKQEEGEWKIATHMINRMPPF